MEAPLSSAKQAQSFRPEGSPRSYLIAPLTVHERIAFRADLTRQAGIAPGQSDLFLGMRAALAELQPANLEELQAMIEAAQAIRARQEEMVLGRLPLTPPTEEEQVALGHCLALEARLSVVPLYAELLNQRDRHNALAPMIAAQHALRGWEGPGLPEFRRENGVVPAELIEALDGLGELNAVGWRSQRLAMPGASAVGNSVSPSPSPETRAPAKAETSPKTAESGSSRGASGKKTRAS